MSDHWRLVLSNGVVVDVRVRECGFVDGGSDSDPWAADCYWCTGFRRPSLLTAVSSLADDVVLECEMAGLDVHVSEIVAPGLMTRDEWTRHETESLRCVYAADADVPGGPSRDEVRERCIAIVEARISEIAEALALPPGRRPDDHVYRARQREALDELRLVRDRMRGVK